MNWLTSLLDPAHPAIWLLGSTAAAIIAVNLAWLIARRSQRSRSTAVQIAAWVAVASFFIFPPLGAWQAGALSPYYLGLSGLDWIPALMAGVPVMGGVMAVLLVGWLAYRRTAPPPGDAAVSDPERIVAALRAPLDAALRQWHWAFYRATAIAWLAATPQDHQLIRALQINSPADALYWGSWLGLLFVIAEWALNPFFRAHVQEATIRQGALAVATTALFVLTRNLWLCLICHIVVETLIVGMLPLPQGATRHEA